MLPIDLTSLASWSIGLIIAIPLVIILLGEIIDRLRQNESQYVQTFELIRSVLLPTVVALIIGRELLNLDRESSSLRILITALLIASAYIGFLLFNAINAEKDAGRWENRVPGLFKTILRIAVVVYPLYLTSGVWGIDLSNFVAALGIGTIAIAFALQDTLSSIVSGFLLVVDKPFAVGDWIEVEGYRGKVIDISWRSTRLQVEQHDVVVIPNLNIAGSSVYNLTMLDLAYRDSITLGFSYEDQPNRVKQVLLDMAHDSPYIAHIPPPKVHTISYDDFTISYKLFYYVSEYKGAMEQANIRDDIMTRVFYTVERNGLSMPYPIQLEGPPSLFEPDPAKIEQDIFNFLKGNQYFSLLNDEVLRRLAEEVDISPFGDGETILTEGTACQSLYLVQSGTVRMLKHGSHFLNGPHQNQNGHVEEILVSSGGIIGEMALMGRRSTLATCLSLGDVNLYKFSPESITSSLEKHPRFALLLNKLVEERIQKFKGKPSYE